MTSPRRTLALAAALLCAALACAEDPSPVVAENALPGNPPSEWQITGAGDPSIQGFATDISVVPGETLELKVASDATDYRIDVYRLGWYAGLGARKVATLQPTAALPQTQPACLSEPATGLVDCGNWTVSASWAVPSNAVSGIYLARLVREDPDDGRASHVIFVVRDDVRGSDLLFQTMDTTWQAYNDYGGNSLYEGSPAGRAYKVSYNRPFDSRAETPEDWVFNAEFPMLRWLEANGYDVSYTTGVDSDRRGEELLEHRVFLSVGHDEYWSAAQRANVEAARDAGVHLAFFSGNEVFWKTRWESSIDGSGTPHRTLVAYKETHAGAKIDPDPAWTGTWRDPRFSPPADGGRPENELTGTIFTVNCCSYPLTVPAEDGQMRFWRNTSIASLAPGQVATLPADTLGYEWDEDLDNGFRPPGLVRLSTTSVSVPQRVVDFGSNYAPAPATHHLVLHRRPNGALVFGAGTIQWAWGLDDAHDRGAPEAPDPRMQQATVNLLADMGVQPQTLQPNLVAATASSDATAPTSSITTPAAGATLAGVITVTGTAADDGGGVVGGVEVSSDDGASWHPASGRESWSWSFTPAASGPLTLRTRAVDDSGNLETPGTGVTITASPRECPCSVWDDSVVPTGNLNENDGQPLELGMKFESAEAGFVTALRFYKSPSSSGVHSGRLWSVGGAQLAQVTFTGQTASGWQQQALPEPIAIEADTTYVVSYHSESSYAFSQDYFTGAVDNPPLRALADGEDGPNAVYTYGAPGDFPDQTYESSNYWVDVVFEPTLPGFRVFGDADAPADPAATQGQPIEVGVKLRAQVAGSVTGLRFYKGPAHAGTHVGHLWTAGGALLASASFDAESASGWQEVALAAAVPLAAGTSYVVSYHSPSGHYGVTDGGLAAGVSAPPLELPADGLDGPNGVFRLGSSGFPDQAGGGDLYFADVVFVPDAPFDATPPSVVSTSPASGATQVPTGSQVSAQLDEALDPASVGSASFELRDPGAALVAASVSWDAPTLRAVLAPDAPLAHATSYTATLRGGPGGVRDAAGNPLAADAVWSFTTAPVPPDEGSGGPILVVASAADPFGRYYAEILRNEGLTQFAVTDVSAVDAARLSQHEVVVLAAMALTPGQAALFTGWVQDGGRLLAMRPDPQLAGLLGLGGAAGTLAEGYLAIDTSGPPGQGLVAETLQFHGTADLWSLAGASAVATLYSDSDTATPHPAVTLASVGTQGGMAAAFSFDLARSVVYTRQGNPAFAGQERDGQPPIRSDDLYWPAYVDLDKVAIPQADEQQRLFAHLVQALAEPPLPRFWYFPRDLEAVVVMTGDEHGCCAGSTTRFAQQLAADPLLCSPEDWECVRSTSYVYPSGALEGEDAALWDARGFELAVHVNTGCADWTPASLDAFFGSQLASFAGFFPSLPAPATNRNHCIAWSDWASGAQVSLAHGVRLDTNYYYWPPEWVANRPGLFTGSGMPMRFADQDGSLIDVYQAATQMTDESDQAYPFTVDTLLDRALGPEGYYGAFVANMHTDAGNSNATAWSASIVASAQARGVPVISARQLLEWLDARNASRFEASAWDGDTLNFTLVPDPAARNLRALLPLAHGELTLATLTRDAQPVAFDVQTRKGVSYAVFSAGPGAYAAQYQADVTPPVISDVVVTPQSDGADVSWSTDEPADSALLLGTDPDALSTVAAHPGLVSGHALSAADLLPATTYRYRVVSVDAAGNPASEPPLASPPASFTTLAAPGVACFEDTSAADFAAGSPDAGLRVAQMAGGELILAPALGVELDGAALPAGWSAVTWEAGGSAQVTGGALVVDGARAGTDASFAPGQSVEFSATFGAAPFQHAGFGVTFESTPFAIFSTGSAGTQLLARSFGPGSQETPLGAGLLGSPHRFRIDWAPATIEYRVDGALVASHPVAIGDAMRPLASDLFAGGSALAVDWLRMPPYAAAGTFASRVFDGGTTTHWQEVGWSADAPAATSSALALRSGDTPAPDATWTAFAPLAGSGSAAGQFGRYAQYRAELASGDAGQTPVLRDVQLACTSEPGDADGDGIADPHETDSGIYASPSDTGSDPLTADSDGDGARDGYEVAAGTDPNDALDAPGAGARLFDLGALAPGAATRAHAVSGDGAVAAGTRVAASGAEAFRFDATGGLVALGDLPGGARAGDARALSDDGSTAFGVGGAPAGDEACRFTQAGGLVGLGDLAGGAQASRVEAASADGAVAVGSGTSAAGEEAFRWTAADGLLGLGDLAGGALASEAHGVSADGAVVVGAGTSAAGREATRWTAAGGMTSLGDLAGGAVDARALGVSANGAVIVGEATSAAGREAFLWRAGKGRRRLGDLAGGAVAGSARAASATGAVIVGSGAAPAGEEAWVWTATTGMRRLEDVMADDFGLDLAGFTRLVSAEDVSDDGTRIAGFGLAGGVEHAFLLRLAGACANGLDDDGDLAADFGSDAGCSSPIDPSELPDCADGLDNDADGLLDFPADPSCASAAVGARENVQCSNGLDDDDDGQIDHPADTRCLNPRDDDEKANPSVCGLGGLDLLPILVAFALLRRRAPAGRRHPRSAEIS